MSCNERTFTDEEVGRQLISLYLSMAGMTRQNSLKARELFGLQAEERPIPTKEQPR